MKNAEQTHSNELKSRRNFLRGAAGVALALPWMESLPLLGAEGASAVQRAASNKPPIRFGTIFFSNGVEPEHWWAKDHDGEMEIGPGLAPMKPHTKDINFIRGLFNEEAFGAKSPHLGRSPSMLSGGLVSFDPSVIRCGKSMDQVMADQIGSQTAIPSLVMGIEPNELRLEDGLSMIYGSSISWATDNRPATKEIYPARAFQRLVGDGRGREIDRSILDSVLSQSHSLESRVSMSDQRKLDEYLDSIRDIEKRIDQASKEQRLEGWQPTLSEPNMERPADELPQNVPDHMKLMLDLIVLAFQMDKTRIATLMLNNDLSQMNFKFLEGVRGALHLDLTHNGKAPELEAMYLKTNQYHVEQFAYLLDRMKGIDEGEGTLLDNSMMMLCSSLFDGDAHSAEQLPILLAGTGGGSLKTGRILDYMESGNENRHASSLYLGIMDRMGVEVDRFSESSSRLANL